MDIEKELKKELLDYLERPHTHKSLLQVLEDFPLKLINEKPAGVPYTFWGLFEHIRIATWDMIDFMQNPGYKEIAWPDDYWPKPEEKATEKMWNESVSKYKKDIEMLDNILKDPSSELFARIPHGKGQTILREVLQIIDHESYHIGQFVLMLRILGHLKDK